MNNLIALMGIFLLGCGEVIPCKTDELGAREVHTGTLRTDGVYISDRGGLSCSGECGSINFIYSTGLYCEGGAIEDSKKNGLTPNTFKYSLSGTERSELGIFWQRGMELVIHSWASTTRPCNKMVAQKGTILNDSTFQIYFWELEGKSHDVTWTFRLYPGIAKPDSTNNFIP